MSWGLRVGPNAEFSVLDPIANSSRLVLPITTAPAARSRVDDRRVVGREVALEDPRRARGRHAVRAHVVLERDGHPGERAGIVTRRDRGIDRRRRRPGRFGADEVEGVDLVFAGVDRGEMPLDDVGRGDRAVANGGGDAGGGGRDGGHAQTLQADDRGNAEPAVLGLRRGGQHLVTVEDRRLDVVAHHVDQRVRLGHRARRRRGRGRRCRRSARARRTAAWSRPRSPRRSDRAGRDGTPWRRRRR